MAFFVKNTAADKASGTLGQAPAPRALPVTAKYQAMQSTTAQQLGMPETTASIFKKSQTAAPNNLIGEVAGGVGGAAKFVANVAATTAKGVGQYLGYGALGGIRTAVSLSPIGNIERKYQQSMLDSGKKIREQATKNLQSGRIDKGEYNREIERATGLEKKASIYDDAWLNVFNAMASKDENGRTDLTRTMIDAYSGGVTLATLPVGGVAGGAKGALTGLAATAKVVGGKQAAKTALGAFSLVDTVVAKGVAKQTAPRIIEGLTKAQAGTAQAAVARFAATKAGQGVANQPAVYLKTAELFDKAMTKVPGFRYTYDSLAKRAFVGSNAKSMVKDIAIEAALRAPIRRENIEFALETIQAYKDDKWWNNEDKMGALPATILQASMLLEGGPIGAVVRNFSKVGKVLKTATYGEAGIVDSIYKYAASMGFSGHATGSIYQALDDLPAYMRSDADNLLKQFFGTNLKGSTADKAAYIMVNHFLDAHPNMAGKDLKDFYVNALKWAYHTNSVMPATTALLNAGKGTAVLAKYSQQDALNLAARLAKASDGAVGKLTKTQRATMTAGDAAERLKARQQAAIQVVLKAVDDNEPWAMNDDVVDSVIKAINKAKTPKGIFKAAQKFDAAEAVNASQKQLQKLVGKATATRVMSSLKAAAKDGYTLVFTKNKNPSLLMDAKSAASVNLKSQFAEVDDAIFEQAATSQPFFRQMGAVLNNVGLGFDESAALSYRMVRDNVAQEIEDGLGSINNGRKLLNILQQSLELPDDNKFKDLTSLTRVAKRTATDLRMLTIPEMRRAFLEADYKFSDEQLKIIKNAIVQGHMRVPLQMIGLADKLVAGSYKYNPLYKYYARTQGALRYTYNPFFAVQELTETEILGQAIAGGKPFWLTGVGVINPSLQAKADDTIKILEKSGFFNDAAKIGKNLDDNLMATRFGEAAQDVYLGRVSAQITKTQKRSMALAVAKIAESKGMSVEDAMRYMGADIEDLVRPIVQYPTHGVLNSNMLKALNIAAFPSRYNIKVATIAAQTLAKSPPATQAVVINKLWEMQNWLKTPSGIAWQQDNAKAIGFFKWLTPIGNIQWVFDTLEAGVDLTGKLAGRKPTGNMTGVGDIGVIGGLPFGVISQILEGQGIITLNTPYVNPSTGDIYSKKIPESMKARVAQALLDFLGSTFTYPGRTLGLPGKTQGMQKLVRIGLDTNTNEWQTRSYTPEQLPNADRLRQEIWAERYSVKNGIENKWDDARDSGKMLPEVTKATVDVKKARQAVPLGGNIRPEEKRQLKKQYSDSVKSYKKSVSTAKAAAKKAAKTKAKTTTFPARLPQ